MAHLDLSYLKQNVSDDEEFLGQLLQVFLDSSAEDVRELSEAVEAREFEKIKRAAHKVKSSFRSLGMEHLTQQLQHIEDLAQSKGSLSEIRDMQEDFSRQYPEVRQEVEAYLAQGM